MGRQIEKREVDHQEVRVQKFWGQTALRQLRLPSVAVIGLGMLGGPVALQLGWLSIPLTLIDYGLVAPANVGTQGFRSDQVGVAKTEARAAQISESIARPKFRLIPSRIEEVGLGTFSKTRLIVSGLDNRASRIRVAEIAQLLGIPMLDLAVDGSGKHLLGNVALYDSRLPDASCYACRYGTHEIAAIRNEGHGPGCPSWRNPSVPKIPPTLAAPAFGLAIAGLATTWAIKVLLDRADQLANTQIQLHADTQTTLRSLKMQRSQHCSLSHSMLKPIRTVPENTTIGGLAKQVVADLGTEPEAFLLRHRNFVSELFCPLDGKTRSLPRISSGYSDDELICGCEPGAEFIPSEQSDRLGQVIWRRHSAMKWRDLALPRSDIVSAIASNGREAHYIIGRPPALRVPGASGADE